MLMLLGAWMLLTIMYMFLAHAHNASFYAGMILLFSEVGLDLYIAGYAYKLLKSSADVYRKILLCFVVAYFIECGVDIILNILVYGIHHYPLTIFEELSIETPFFIFLILQIFSWYQLLSICKNTPNNLYSWVIVAPFTMLGGLLLFLFMLAFDWRLTFVTVSGVIQVIAVVLNLLNFVMSALCLSTAKDKSISYLSVGALILSTKDISERFSILSNEYLVFNDVEMFWVLGLCIFAYGLYCANKNNVFQANDFCLSSLKGLQAQYTFFGFTIFIFSFILFLIFLCLYSYIQHSDFNQILGYISSFVMVYSVITIVISKFFAQKILSSFKTIKYLVDSFKENCLEDITAQHRGSNIAEIAELEYCLITARAAVSDKLKAEKFMFNLASQVVHDIRSPVAVLEIMLNDMNSISEEKRNIVRGSVGRIRDIANNLLSHARNKQENDVSLECMLSSAIDFVVSEKRTQFKNNPDIKINFLPRADAYGLFAKINLTEFKCVLSNLINNAVEAIKISGEVHVALIDEGQYSLIKVKDTGPGIPKKVLDNIGRWGNTYGKVEGNGLGLPHAFDVIQKYNGSIDIETSFQFGTTIIIKLPKVDAPSWFVKSLIIRPYMQILILDDDDNVHHAWDEKFSSFNFLQQQITVHHFKTKNMLAYWLDNNDIQSKPILFLCDYEIMGSDETGIEIIQSFKLAPYSVLVTGRCEELLIQKYCEKIKIFLLPKSLTNIIPVSIDG